MLLIAICVAVLLLVVVVTSRRRLRQAIQLGIDLLDLVRLLVVLRVKAARVRSVDW